MNNKEPPPIPNFEKAIWDLVIEDIRDRDEFGNRKYKTRLRPFNGRNSSIDLYQELLDATAYSRQQAIEREEMIHILKIYATADKIRCDICGVSSKLAEDLLKKLGER